MTKRRVTGASLVCLALLSTACGQQPTVPVIQREVIEVEVPVLTPLDAELTAPCHITEPNVGFRVNEHLALLALSLYNDLANCNAQLGKIRELQPASE